MKPWATALSLLGVGFFIAISILVGVLGGNWLDQKLGTSPLFLIAGLILGLAVAVYGTWGMIKPILQDYNKKDKDNK